MKLPDGVWECVACKGLNPPSTLRCNACGIPRFGRDGHEDTEPAAIVEKIARKARRTPAERMNRSEREVMAILEGAGNEVFPQALTLTFNDGTTYRPDFLVLLPCPRVIEVKGGYRGPGWEQGIERYRRAKEKWGAWFEFELWTKKGGKWEVS